MSPTINTIAKTLSLLPRAALVALLIAAPALVAPSLAGSKDTLIEAPAHKKMGAGLVILVSLQRG
ncbi:hypothetical protein [Arvimicrobium flavum]|uniref:hypothetical protein n=1 Tax=Arvimicrobium flavum TaxID=3393320 RepID=UPI00237B8DFB|nr:hypothetical protein [Mesorhizobium shangrilense]